MPLRRSSFGVQLDGAWNFRDLGGYQTRNGRRLAYGRVYRSNNLDDLTDRDLDALRALGVATVYDLRRQSEVPEGYVCALPFAERVHLPMGSDDDLGATLSCTDVATPRDYWRLAVDHHDVISLIFEGLAEDRRLPAIIHCSSGKDRTGVVCALLLTLIGVPGISVLDDFEQSQELWQSCGERRLDVRAQDAHDVGIDTIIHRQAMEEFISRLVERHGSVEQWLAGDVGEAGRTLRRLRSSLLVRA
jgi:protein-tyrosine phosphatase